MSASLPRRVLVTGASGFIGSRLCEVMALTRAFEPRAFVHSTGSAWRIARLPLDFAVGDLCDRGSVDHALEDCDAVVHLARGDDTVMRRGLENVLRAAVRHRVARVVHLSSVAVYGDHPPAESVSEDAPARWTDLEYGNAKLEQERRALRYWKRHGLNVVILRPPPVYGPFGSFTLGLIDRLQSRGIAIVDGGRNPCNLVYVDNLVEAILLALWRPEAPGQTFFVTDPDPLTWERCLLDHAALVGVDVPRVAAADLVRPPRQRLILDSWRALPGVIADPELRRVVTRIPVVKRTNDLLYRWFQALSEQTKETIRLSLRGPDRVVRQRPFEPRFRADDPYIAIQRRGVAHSCDKARRLLGYTAPVTYADGMRLTADWLRFARVVAAGR